MKTDQLKQKVFSSPQVMSLALGIHAEDALRVLRFRHMGITHDTRYVQTGQGDRFFFHDPNSISASAEIPFFVVFQNLELTLWVSYSFDFNILAWWVDY